MKTIVVDVTLHARAELMAEFKAGRQAEWDPKYEIEVWKNREVELSGLESGEERVAKAPSLRIEGP